MMELVWDPGFKRAYRKRIQRDTFLPKRFRTSIQKFVEDPFDTSLKIHNLPGRLQGLWAFSVAYDCRVVFKFIEKQQAALLIDIGSHDELS